MKIAMLTMEKYDNRRPNSVGSSRIRGRWVMKYCDQIQEFKNGGQYDAVIYQKAYWKEHMKAFKGIKIFDLCDPDWLEGRPVTEIAEYVDAFTVTTEKMKDYLSQLIDKPIIVIPDRIDPEEHFPIKENHIGKARSVVWFGYQSNQVVLDQCMVFLENNLLQLVVISERGYAPASVNIKYDYGTINDEIIKHDMVLLPTFDHDLRHQFKSNNKTLSSWALKMPVATGPEDILKFMKAEDRQKEADEKYKYVMEQCHVRQSGPEYVTLIEDLVKRR